MKMKLSVRISCAALSFLILFALVSCSGKPASESEKTTSDSASDISPDTERVGKEVYGLKKLSDEDVSDVSHILKPENISKDGVWKEHAFAVIEKETGEELLTFSLPFAQKEDLDFFGEFREEDCVQYSSDKRTLFSAALSEGNENCVSLLYIAEKNEIRLLPWGQYMSAGDCFVCLESNSNSGKGGKICLYSLDGDFLKTVAGENSVDTVCYIGDSTLYYAYAEKNDSEDNKELNYMLFRYDLKTEEQTQLTEFSAYYITGMDDSRVICYGVDGEKIVNY